MGNKGYWFIILCFLPCIIISQTCSDSSKTFFEVTLSTFVEPREVPLNRTLSYIVNIEWQGQLQQYEIEAIEEPVLSNFDILGSSASNKTTGVSGYVKAVKQIIYTLSPKTLGMGYIEPVSVTYQETGSGQSHVLKTQRIGVEVLAPVKEKTSLLPVWFLPAVILSALIIIISSILIIRKRKQQSSTEEEIQPILEETCLSELKESVDLETTDRREAFTQLSRLFRKYLSEKYQLTALEATTSELIHILKEEALEEGLIRKCEQLFEKADVVKFSGQDAEKSELETAYTTVETILESNLAKEARLLL